MSRLDRVHADGLQYDPRIPEMEPLMTDEDELLVHRLAGLHL